MNQPPDFSLSAINKKRGMTAPAAAGQASTTASPPPIPSGSREGATTLPPQQDAFIPAPPSAAGGAGFKLPFDPLRLVDAVYRKLWLGLLLGLSLALLMAYVGSRKFETKHLARVELLRQKATTGLRASETGEPFKPRELSIPTLTNLMRSSTVLERVSKNSATPVPEDKILSGLTITPERNTDIIRIIYNSNSSAQTAVDVLNAYVEEVLRLTREMQRQDAVDMNLFLKQQIARTDADLVKVNEELLNYSRQTELLDANKQMDAYLSEAANFNLKYETVRLDFGTLDLRIKAVEEELSKVNSHAGKLQAARDELATLLTRYTDLHPLVIEARDRLALLEAAKENTVVQTEAPPQPGESAVAESLYLELVELRTQKQVLSEQLSKLDDLRHVPMEKLQQLPRKALEYAEIKARQQALETSRSLLASRQREAELYEDHSMGDYRLLAPARLKDVEVEGPAKKLIMVTAAGFMAGLCAVVGLALLLELLDFRVKTPGDLAIATKLPVVGTLSEREPADPAAREEWAFRQWTALAPSLKTNAEGSMLCGLIGMGCDEAAVRFANLFALAAAQRGAPVIVIRPPNPGENGLQLSEALQRPAAALDVLAEHHKETPLPVLIDEDWNWNSEQRELLAAALFRWQRQRALVVLMALAKAGRPETLLSAEMLPNLFWVSKGGQLNRASLAEKVQTYQQAGCHLAGALMEGMPWLKPGVLNRLAGAALVTLLSCPFSPAARAAEARPNTTSPAGASASSSSPSRWTQNLTLQPGDGVNISVFGQPALARSSLLLGPDGRLTYLQIQDFMAAGLTIDQLRDQLNAEMRKYYKNHHLVVTPYTFQSRKVFLLGKVAKKGAVNMDRPLTVLDAVTEAGGLETGLLQQNTVELADLGRSFIVRGGNRLPVDLEALLLRGDKSQNVFLEPDDYLYFPSATTNEIYVLGNVSAQGSQGLLTNTSVHSAITMAGGFTKKAFRHRVLVVRGSLEKPETYVVNMADVLAGRSPGFRLMPRDIVYVADKPWARAEELLDFALTAFVQSAVATWTGANIGPFITQPILPQLKSEAEQQQRQRQSYP